MHLSMTRHTRTESRPGGPTVNLTRSKPSGSMSLISLEHPTMAVMPSTIMTIHREIITTLVTEKRSVCVVTPRSSGPDCGCVRQHSWKTSKVVSIQFARNPGRIIVRSLHFATSINTLLTSQQLSVDHCCCTRMRPSKHPTRRSPPTSLQVSTADCTNRHTNVP